MSTGILSHAVPGFWDKTHCPGCPTLSHTQVGQSLTCGNTTYPQAKPLVPRKPLGQHYCHNGNKPLTWAFVLSQPVPYYVRGRYSPPTATPLRPVRPTTRGKR